VSVDERRETWARLARDLPLALLDGMTETVPLSALPALAPRILAGEIGDGSLRRSEFVMFCFIYR